MPRGTYSKPKTLELIFTSKFDPEHPQPQIPFTRQEVAKAIVATGGTVPHNLNNFVKDMCRQGGHDPKSPTARAYGYGVKEGTHRTEMGFFFRLKRGELTPNAIICPADLAPTPIEISMPADIADLVRPDEGGLLSVLEYGRMLDKFFGVPNGTVQRVQSPVKVQPYEIDGFFVMRRGDHRVAIACEAKSQTADEITMNQILGIATETLTRLLRPDMKSVIPVGAKILKNGDIFIAEFPEYVEADIPQLSTKLVAGACIKRVRYAPSPRPPAWRSAGPAQHQDLFSQLLPRRRREPRPK
jgi:hypothetical protein